MADDPLYIVTLDFRRLTISNQSAERDKYLFVTRSLGTAIEAYLGADDLIMHNPVIAPILNWALIDLGTSFRQSGNLHIFTLGVMKKAQILFLPSGQRKSL